MAVVIGLLWLYPAVSAVAQEQCVTDAWEAFNRRDYPVAIREADKCIDDFGRAATRQQDAMDSGQVPCPPTGTVSDVEKNRIFGRGLLNDVATAYFIKGRSAEYVFRESGPESASYRAKAENAYRTACEYRCGRTWDPRGWFWSPCEAASDRIPLNLNG